MEILGIQTSSVKVEISPVEAIETLLSEMLKKLNLSCEHFITDDGFWAFWDRGSNYPTKGLKATPQQISVMKALDALKSNVEIFDI